MRGSERGLRPLKRAKWIDDHVVKVREVRLAAGAEFTIMTSGDIMTMPGLPKVPATSRIDRNEDDRVVGLI